MKILKYFAIFLGLLFVIYGLGPRAKFAGVQSSIPKINLDLHSIETFLTTKRSAIPDLKPSNTHELVFYDGVKQTDFVLLYLHGFSASPKEGFPLHQEFAKRYGMNFFAPLLAGHGRATKESFMDLVPNDLMNDAREALSIAGILGKEIVVMSCSTGSTLSIYLAAENPGLIHSQIMFSPNIDLADPTSKLLTKPWGLSIAKAVTGSDYHSFEMPTESKPFWTTEYRIEGLVALRDLLNQTMTPETFGKISSPFFIGYYYEDETHKDDVISVAAILDFEKKVGTSDGNRWVVPFIEPKSHVINCGIQPTVDIGAVRKKTFEFADQVLNFIPVPETVLESKLLLSPVE